MMMSGRFQSPFQTIENIHKYHIPPSTPFKITNICILKYTLQRIQIIILYEIIFFTEKNSDYYLQIAQMDSD